MKYLATILFLTLLAGCSSGVKPQTPRQIYAVASGDFDAAQAIAIKYEALPPCGGAAKVCRDEAVVANIKAATKRASAALDAARNTINDPNFSQGAAQEALVIAQNALALLTSITATLPVK